MYKPLLHLFVSVSLLIMLISCGNVEDPEADSQENDVRLLAQDSMAADIINRLSKDFASAGFSESRRLPIIQGAEDAVTSYNLSDSSEINLLLPRILAGAQDKLILIGSDDSKILGIETILASLTQSLNGRLSSPSLLDRFKQRVSRVLEGESAPNASFFNPPKTYHGIYKNMIGLSIHRIAYLNMQESKRISASKSALRIMVGNLNASGADSSDFEDIVKQSVEEAIGQLDDAGISDANLGTAIQEIVEAAVIGLDDNGLDSTTISGSVASIVEGAIVALDEAGITSDDYDTVISVITTAINSGMDEAGVSTTDQTNVQNAITEAATDGKSQLVENERPVAHDQSITLSEDNVQVITLSGSDPESKPITFSVVSNPEHGTLSGTAPNLAYTPEANYFGTDTFNFKVNDASFDSRPGTINLTISAVNDEPSADSQSLSTNEDTDLDITLTGSDIEASSLTYSIVGQPANGSIEGTPPNITYKPNANFNGQDSFTFYANDGEIDSALPATVTITVNTINDKPTPNPQSVVTNEDESLAITLTGNDVENSTLTYSIVLVPSNGSLSGTPPNITYTPTSNFYGTDSFSFKVNDGEDDNIANALVSVTVNPVNDRPTCDSQSVSTNEDVNLNITLTGSDIEGNTLSFSIVTNPSNGSLTGTPPSITYEPDLNFNGQDSFTYNVNDGETNSLSPATVNITVSAVNDPPTIGGSPSTSIASDSNYSFTPTADDIDVGDGLSFSINNKPSWATFDSNSGQLAGIPAESDVNTYSNIQISVTDGSADTELPAFSIIVTDGTPPNNITNFTATAGNGSVNLTWTNPGSADFQNVVVRRRSDTYPTAYNDGFQVYNGNLTSVSDSGLTNGTTYYYKAFAYDEVPNYSSGVTASATPISIVDNNAPTSPSVTINGGAASTTSTSVTLTLSASDNVGVTAYYASESSTTPSQTDSGWISVTSATSYSGDVSFTLSSGTGTKTVYLWFKDAAGNVSSRVNDSIIVDGIPTNGLIGYYPFNGNANDESSNNNDGTVYGATLTTDRHGNANSAYSFDGVNDVISIAVGSDFSVSNVTISVWTNPTGGGSYAYPRVVSINIPGSKTPYYSILLGYHTSNPRYFRFYGSESGSAWSGESSAILSNNTGWYHLVVIYDGTDADFYINGSFDKTVTISKTLDSFTNAVLHIGGTYGFSTDYVQGSIDDIRIYNRTLSSSEVSALFNEGLDATPPTLSEVTGISTPTNNSTPSYTFSSDEAGTISYGGDCSSSTTNAVAGNNTITFNTLSDGAHTNCTITVTDSSSNASSPLSVSSFTVDTVAPSAPNVNGTTPTNDTTPTWSWTSGGGGNGNYRYKLNDSNLTSGATQNNVTTYTHSSALSEATHTLYVQERDDAGNWSSSGSKAIVIDITAPSLTETSAVTSPTNVNTPSYTFNSSEAGTISYGGSCSSSTTSAGSGDNTITLNTLSDGTYSNCTITVTDSVGNASSALSISSFTVDTTAPTLSETTPVTSPTTDNTPNYTFSSSEAGTITYGGSCSSSTTTAGAGDNTITFNDLSDGTYSNCTITVTDSAGNTSSTLNVTSFTVNTSGGGDSEAPTNPSITINSGASSTNSTSVIITLSATDNTAVTAYYASESSTAPSSGAGGWISVTSAASYTGSANYTLNTGDGTKTVYVWFKDAAGNLSSSSNDSIDLNSQSQTFNPSDGLVAYYPFNGNANDESGNGHNGIVNGATLSFDREGNSNKAFSFDGVNDFIEIPHSDDLSIGTGAGKKFTFTLWYKTNSTGNNQVLITKRQQDVAINVDYVVLLEDGKLKWGTGDASDTCTWNTNVIEPSANMWHFIVVSLESTASTTGSKKIYIDGVKKNDCTYSLKSSSDTNSLLIGKVLSTTGFEFNGEIDDIRIYNLILSSEEIEALYAQESGMVLIDGGTFQMGDLAGDGQADELPVHSVTLSDFYISDHEVTATEYKECVDAGGCTYSGGTASYYTYEASGKENHPINYVSWNDTQDFILWKNQNSGITYRLCSESEWEYAARAGSETKYLCGENSTCLDNTAWYSSNSGSSTNPAKSKQSNPWNLYDMNGNIYEWVQDWYHSSYSTAPNDGSAWESPVGSQKVARGGWFNNSAPDLRSARRGTALPSTRNYYIGFRLCAVKSKLPDTGQTTSYTDTFGEDHDYTINPPNYTAIDIVNDSNTSNDIVIDNNTGLIWQREDDNTTRTWADAGAYCENLNLGGYGDWRLPSRRELMSIVNYGKDNPSINSTLFPNVNSSYYWSSSVSAYDSRLWYLDFNTGWVSLSPDTSYLVRCVRGQANTTESYIDNGDGTITDNSTRLAWQKEDNNSTYTWEQALNYCDNLNLASKNDWRLPNVKELESIVKETNHDPGINQVYFPNTNSSYYWSSTTLNSASNSAWIVNFFHVHASYLNKTDSNYVRCVRGPDTSSVNWTGTWTQATASAGWSARHEHNSVVFNNKLWVMAGYASAPVNDVWYSSDGVNWTQATSSASWSARYNVYPGVVFNNKIWLSGGLDGSSYLNDVWYSSDGNSWTRSTASASWLGRASHGNVAFNNELWVFAGNNGSTNLTDAWKSNDGITWSQASSAVPAKRAFATVVFDNKIWIMGGIESGNNYTNDIWYSSDGNSWTQATASAAWTGRHGLTSVAFDNKMWILGGYNGGYLSDVWYSTDGATWTQQTSSAPWTGRYLHTAVVYNNSIWILGGFNGSGLNDVWYME